MVLTPLGTEPLAGDPLHGPPSVTITGPTGTVSTDGPVLSVEWTYGQPQGDPQEWFRVLATNDTGDTTYYDSGWTGGDDAALAVNIDAETIPHDSSDLTWVVQVRGPELIGTGEVARYQAENDAAIVMAWGNPQTTITAPVDNATVGEPGGLVVSWSFADPGKTQSAYRVRLLYEDSQSEVFSSGWVVSTATSATLDFLLLDATRYLVEVQTKNNHGIRSA